MASFTKGKWQWGGNSIFANVYVGNFLVASLSGEGDERLERDANARLIAAAPEMYELLKVSTTIGGQPGLREAQEKARELLARIDGKEINNA